MTDASENHECTVSIKGRTINLYFADDISGLAREEELAKLVKQLNKAFTACGMEISAEKTKLMTNNTSSINIEVKVNETVISLKHLGSVVSDEPGPAKEPNILEHCLQPEIVSRIAQMTAALTKLKPVLNDRSISFSSKI